MAPTPRLSLNDDFAAHLNCPICGKASLIVHHTASLPDFVSCRSCGSAFVVEADGDRVLYGKINDQYPRAQQFALKQWVMLEAVERRASDERAEEEETTAPPAVEAAPTPAAREAAPPPPGPAEDLLRSAAVPIPTEPDLNWPPKKIIPLEADTEPEPIQPDRVAPSPLPPASVEPELPKAAQAPPPSAPPIPAKPEIPSGVDLGKIGIPQTPPAEKEHLIDTPVFPQGMKLDHLQEDRAPEPLQPKPEGIPAVPPQAPARPAPQPPVLELRENDPPQGIRHRVVIRGEKVTFPKKACAHCQGTPVRGRLTIIGDLPQGQKIGQRKKATFNLPLCAECHDRAQSVTPEEKAERLQANLLAMLIMMVVLVAALAWGLDLQEDPIRGFIIILILGLVGYFVPSYFLLKRIKPSPPSPNSAYIRSTLLIPDDAQGLETAFEFRNKEYAEQFFTANETFTLGKPVQVKDRAYTRPRPPEPPPA
jgi:transcription elongation factor Elf1